MFNVGDIVRIRSDLIAGEDYGNIVCLTNMQKEAGKTIKIHQLTAEGNISSNEAQFYYSPEMLQAKFDWDSFKNGEFAVWCETHDDAKAFLKLCNQHGIKWSNHENTTEFDYWYNYKNNTCYALLSCDSGLGYCDKSFYETQRIIPIINFKNLYFKEEPTMNAKIYQLKKQLIKLNKEMNEKLEKFNMERQSIMDEIEKLKTQPVFTLSGFLNGEFAVSFASDFERGIFMGWLQITTDTVWGSKRRPVQYKPQKYVIMLEETLQTGTAVDRLRVPVIQFDTSWFSDTAPFL